MYIVAMRGQCGIKIRSMRGFTTGNDLVFFLRCDSLQRKLTGDYWHHYTVTELYADKPPHNLNKAELEKLQATFDATYEAQ